MSYHYPPPNNPIHVDTNQYGQQTYNPYATGYGQAGPNFVQTNPQFVQTNPQYTYNPNETYGEPEYVPSNDTYRANHEEQGEKFKGESEWRDLPFLFLFLIHFGGIAAIIGYGLTLPQDPTKGFLPANITDADIKPEAISVGILVLVAILLSAVYVQLLKVFARPMIYIGIVLNLLTFLAGAIYMGMQGAIAGAVLLGIMFIFVAFYFISVRNRIPFAVEMIQAVVNIVQSYPATHMIAYSSIVVQIAWTFTWFAAFILCQRFEQTLSYVATVFLIFSFYWTFEVIKNVVHCSVSGLVATVYFMGDMMPTHPTLGSLKRSLTTSFGSICLGSLIVAAIKTIRTLVRMARNEDNSILLCIVDCILGCIDSLVQYFNHYAFCQVAIYGKTFCGAAKATWRLFQESGLEAIANDNLIDGVLWMGVLLNAIITAFVGVLTGYFIGHGQPDAITFGVIGFFIGLSIMILSMQVIDSSVTCSFVCFAEDKETLHRTNPQLYQRLMETYSLNW